MRKERWLRSGCWGLISGLAMRGFGVFLRGNHVRRLKGSLTDEGRHGMWIGDPWILLMIGSASRRILQETS